MSDIDPTELTSHSLRVAETTSSSDLTELLSPGFERRKAAEREGLPPGYRMRADAHYVDQLSARSAATEAPLRSLSIDDIDAPDADDLVDPSDLQSLIDSVAEHGVIQPLLVRRQGTRYQLIAGRKRLAAARAAAVLRVPCVVHTIDEAQAAAIAQAAGVHAGSVAEPSAHAKALYPAASQAHAALTRSLNTIQSAAALLADDGSPMARRVALDLVRAEAWRASWQLRAAAMIDGSDTWRLERLLLGPALERIRDGFMAEYRLRGVELTLHVPDWNASADLDAAGFQCGVTGAIVATVAVCGDAEPARLVVSARRMDDRFLAIEVSQDVVTPSPEVTSRFFDAAWTAHPGGPLAVLGATVARIVAEWHGGRAELIAGSVAGGRGSTARLTLARSSRTA